MKNITEILEGLFSRDIANVKGYEPIDMPGLDDKIFAFNLVKPHIQATIAAVNERFMLTLINELKKVLDEIEPEEIEEMQKIPKSFSKSAKKQKMWASLEELKKYLVDDFEIEDQEALDNYDLWSGFAKAIRELFTDSLVKKYIMSGDGIFYFVDNEVLWHQRKKTTLDVDAIIKKVQKILPSNLISVTQGKEGGMGTEIQFDTAALSNY